MSKEIIFFHVQYFPTMKVQSLFAMGTKKCNLDMEYHFVLTEMFRFSKLALKISDSKT